jgi:hypothetical protein
MRTPRSCSRFVPPCNRHIEPHLWFVWSWTATHVHYEPSIRDLNMSRCTFAVASAQNATAKDFFIKIGRPVDVGDSNEMCDGEPLSRWHLIIALFGR